MVLDECPKLSNDKNKIYESLSKDEIAEIDSKKKADLENNLISKDEYDYWQKNIRYKQRDR